MAGLGLGGLCGPFPHYHQNDSDSLQLLFGCTVPAPALQGQQAGNVLTYKHLAYVQAAILMWCDFNQIPYEIYAASHWRKVLGGKFGRKREEQKQHALDLVKDYCGQEVTSDEADAICIGLAAIRERKENTVGFGSV